MTTFIPPTARAPKHPKFDAIHRALLTGLLSNVGMKGDGYEYVGPRGVRFNIFPGSGLFSVKPKWVMAAELVETTKLYGRTCAGVQPQWIERAAGHLVERAYSEPRWDAKTGGVIATERVTLHGLVLVAGRVVPYGPINARVSREIFIHHALVLGDIRMAPFDVPFFRHNAALVTEVEGLEAKIRQKNLLADVATRYAFYDARVPQDVVNAQGFETWRRGAERADARLLYMKKEDLLRSDAPEITPANYPDKVADSGGGLQLPLTYKFEPGEVVDGVTLTVPVAALSQLRAEHYEWMVPGMLEEKVAGLMKGLPGSLRRNFVPVPAWAKEAAAALLEGHLPEGDVGLREALAGYLAKRTGVEVRASDFSEGELPEYLRMNFKVVEDSGKVLGLGRDLPLLQRKLASHATDTFSTIYDKTYNREPVLAWDFGDLPETVTVQRFKMTIVAYPALVESGEVCALRLFPSKESCDGAHRAGVRRLFRMEYRKDVKSLAGNLPGFGQMALHWFTLAGSGGEDAKARGRYSEELREELVGLVVDRALFAEDAVPRGREAWEGLKRKAAARLFEVGDKVCGLVGEILAQHHALILALENVPRDAAALDVREQRAYLMGKGFLLGTPWVWLENFPRYLAGMRLRLEKLGSGRGLQARDDEGMLAVAPFWNLYVERLAKHRAMGVHDGELELFRWMVEEYRVSLFAQELGTQMPVSVRRLERQWEKVRA